MGTFVVNPETGERKFMHADGEIVDIGETSILEQAGRQVGSYASAAADIIGSAAGNEDLQNWARKTSLERERQFAPTDITQPWTSMLGQAVPGLATAGITGGRSVTGQLLTNTAIGAAESALDYDQGGSYLSRGLVGGFAGAAGDQAGRMIGRVFNAARGVADDLIRTRRQAASDPAAAAYEAAGGRTMAYQRFAEDEPGRGVAERAAQYAQASGNPPESMVGVMKHNDTLHRNKAIEAVGLDPGVDAPNYPRLDRTFINDALDRFNAEFGNIARQAGDAGQITIDEATAGKLARIPEIKELIELGDFADLDRNIISGDDWMTAREALSEAAANRYQNGRSKSGEKLYRMVDDLDASIGDSVPADYLADYARLREQYRVFTQLEKPNVISNDGQINIRTLRRALDSRSTGFGRTATGGGETVNPETSQLIELAQLADNPQFKAFQTSGTAENLATRELISEGVDASLDFATTGNPTGILGTAYKFMVPKLVGASQMGNGATYRGLAADAPQSVVRAGGMVGRSMLDDYLYPFVGVEDERPQPPLR